jgi:hypothetical protein
MPPANDMFVFRLFAVLLGGVLKGPLELIVHRLVGDAFGPVRLVLQKRRFRARSTSCGRRTRCNYISRFDYNLMQGS